MAKPLDLAQRGHVVHGRRNIIHNGAFTVDQRATPVTFTNGTTKTVDRWRASSGLLDEATVVMQQSTTVPSGAGFGNSLQFNVTGTESALDAAENFWVGHFMEGQNLQQLAHGTSSAKKITLSFWVRSHVAGDFGILFYKSNSTRSYTASYTVNAIDTWEYKTITIDGDTSGAILNDNSNQMGIYFSLAMGSNYYGAGAAAWSGHSSNKFSISTQTNILSATGSWYITGVQLEVGETATPFEHRSYGEELALCQRYYEEGSYIFSGDVTSGATYYNEVHFKVTKRASPSTSPSPISTTGGSGFNTGQQVVNAINETRIQISEVCDLTVTGGYFVGTYAADAEL